MVRLFLFTLLITNSLFAQMQRREKSIMNIGEIIESEMGTDVYVQALEEFGEGIKIVECPKFKINFVTFPYQKGDVIPYFKDRKNYKLFFDPAHKNYLDSGTIGIAYDNKQDIYVPYIDSFNGFLTKDQKGKMIVEKTEYTNLKCDGCYKKVLIYNGKSGSSVKFTYREFINDLARPAFTQDLQYDLNDGKIIGFKGLRLEIIETSNIGIKYKILNPFN